MIITVQTSFKNMDGDTVRKVEITENDIDSLKQLSSHEKILVREILKLDFPGLIIDLSRKKVNDLKC